MSKVRICKSNCLEYNQNSPVLTPISNVDDYSISININSKNNNHALHQDDNVKFIELSVFETVLTKFHLNSAMRIQTILLCNSQAQRCSHPVIISRHVHFLDCHWSFPSAGEVVCIGLKCLETKRLIGVAAAQRDSSVEWVDVMSIGVDHDDQLCHRHGDSTLNVVTINIGQCLLVSKRVDDHHIAFNVACSLRPNLDVSGRLWIRTHCKLKCNLIAIDYSFGREACIRLKKKAGLYYQLNVEVQQSGGQIIGTCTFSLNEGNQESQVYSPILIKSTCIGKMRLSIKLLSEDHAVLPLEKYSGLNDLIVSGHKHVAALLVTRKLDYSPTLVQALLDVYMDTGLANDFLQQILCLEIDRIDENDLNTAFRGNSFATKAVELFQFQVCSDYLQSVYGLCVSQLMKRSVSPIDIIDQILFSIGKVKLPSQIRRLYAAIKAAVSNRFPRPSFIHIHSITTFLFIRLHLPVLLNPGLLKNSIDVEGPLDRILCPHRVLVAKLFAKLASLAEFSESDTLSEYNEALRLRFPDVCMIVMHSAEDTDLLNANGNNNAYNNNGNNKRNHRNGNDDKNVSDRERQVDLHNLHMYFSGLLNRYPTKQASSADGEEQRLSILSTASSTHSLLRAEPLDPAIESDPNHTIAGWWISMAQCIALLDNLEKDTMHESKKAARDSLEKLRRSSALLLL